MHDPDVLVFDIRLPWRDRHGYRRSIVNVWHHEPGGADSGDVCKHYRRWQEPDGAWKSEALHIWRWHVHHWRIQVHPLGALRRRVIDRCAWCGGRHTKTNPVNVSTQWDARRSHWWASTPDIYHATCHSAWSARLGCSCEKPITTDRWGTCAHCGLRLYDRSDLQREADRILTEMVPSGTAPRPEVMSLVRNLWAVHRAQQEA